MSKLTFIQHEPNLTIINSFRICSGNFILLC